MGYKEVDICDECKSERDRLNSGYSVGGWIRLDTGSGFPDHPISKGYDFCKYECLIRFLNKVATKANKE